MELYSLYSTWYNNYLGSNSDTIHCSAESNQWETWNEDHSCQGLLLDIITVHSSVLLRKCSHGANFWSTEYRKPHGDRNHNRPGIHVICSGSIRTESRKIARKWKSKFRCDCKASETTPIKKKKKARKLGYKLHSPWFVRHPVIVIFFLTFRFEEKKIILDIVWHFGQLSWMWWYSGSLSSCVNLHITTWKSCWL